MLESLFLNSDFATESAQRYVVAYSGGLDSHVLLHLCALFTKQPVLAIYIHHGLQKEADEWEEHCAEICDSLNVPFKSIHVDASKRPGESPEETARKARYSALNSQLKVGDCLLTAHHRDDQTETVLLQLCRGAGVAGLAAMPDIREMGIAYHARPLLNFSRDEITEYANKSKLKWIEDSSNKDTAFDRNLLRHDVVPVVKKRWPQLGESLLKVASQQQDALEIIEAMAAIDLATIVTQKPHIINISELTKLSRARQLNVLRSWIHQCASDAPTANILHQIIESMLMAAKDASPKIYWGKSEIRRYQGRLYCLKSLEHDVTEIYYWNPKEKLKIESLGIQLSVEKKRPQGLKPELLNEILKVSFRQGGEDIRPAGRRNTHSLKKLFQEVGVPPWERSRIPLIYLDDMLICVSGYWVADDCSVEQGCDGWLVCVE